MFPPPKPYMHFTSTTRPAHLISLDQISRIIFGEDRKSRISPCAISFSLLFFPPSWAQKSSSQPHPFPSTSTPIHFSPIYVAIESTQTDVRTDGQCRQKRNVNTTFKVLYYLTQYRIVSGYPIPRTACIQTFQGRTRHAPGNRRREYPD